MEGVAVGNQGIRRLILQQAKRANVGHIGSALSSVDLIAAIHDSLRTTSDHRDRDRFILSNGHAALALYAVLHARGRITADVLDTYAGDASRLGVHPQHSQDGVDFTTGSLGQGLPIAAGGALAARMQSSSRRFFVSMSDAECNEGSVWEAAMFAAHHQLSNLIAIIDLNGQQALGYTRDVLDLSPLAERWRVFGWDVHEVAGNDSAAISASIASIGTVSGGAPHVILAHTTFGYGVSFMQNRLSWHYSSLSDAEFAAAMAELTDTAS